MKWRIDKDGYFIAYCSRCKRELEPGFLIRLGETGVHCIFCGNHLGYVHDVPEEFRKAWKWEEGENIKGGL